MNNKINKNAPRDGFPNEMGGLLSERVSTCVGNNEPIDRYRCTTCESMDFFFFFFLVYVIYFNVFFNFIFLTRRIEVSPGTEGVEKIIEKKFNVIWR